MGACCAPSGPARDDGPARAHAPGVSGVELVDVPGGTFTMGSDGPEAYPMDGEGPARDVTAGDVRIGRHPVTVGEWRAFVDATGHVSDAERFGWSFVFGGFLPDDFPPTRGVAAAPWWRQVEGADWAHPDGPQSDADGRDRHPVTHVSWRDASSFATWAGGRLPTEAEWEHAARGGLDGAVFPWGDELEPGGEHRMNVWQGTFPSRDTAADGWSGTSPVDAFSPNGYGLHDVTGNVWEWCSDAFDSSGARVSKGGSYLCHASYCRRYRPAARQGSGPDSSTGNLGFRLAVDPR
ncbi:formylglycine-generating enzyme family protein [Solicola sp. PLA-1-18]|uniref:formylglycine-generating enzyme family protein n=1 Tax=Solicola sp. PLA-1-18 TaxID=3380532 RepID=UPI003B79782F